MVAGGGALLGAGLAAGSAAASTKMTQKATGYQDTPRGKAQCDNCAQWQPAASCKLVDGVISPTGWCRVYAPKS
ncbi:MAG TPA: high-potential iron-sulfur protein [Caulobacteraceae bacterium]